MSRRVEVRALDGESIVVEISSDRTVGDLKTLLRDSFPPAKCTLSFHLFFKGANLSSRSCIEACKVGDGDFMVLVPFMKKDPKISTPSACCEQATESRESSCPQVVSDAANFAWRDIMDDLTSLSDILPKNSTPRFHNTSCKSRDDHTNVTNSGPSNYPPNVKRKRKSYGNNALQNILFSGPMDLFDQKTCNTIRELVESVGCLSNSSTGRCLLLEEFTRTCDKMEHCLCPEWLKRVIKIFTFLNILYAFFHMQHKIVAWGFLEDTLMQGKNIGLVDMRVLDVKNLSILCPKVVIILGKQEAKSYNLASLIIIGDSSTALRDPTETANNLKTVRRPLKSTILSAIEKRKASFKTLLWKTVRFSMKKSCVQANMPTIPCLENILLSMEDDTTITGGCKSERSNYSALATGCHDVNVLEVSEMLEHLRKGLGVFGQIEHIEEISAKQAVYVEIPEILSEITKTTLKIIGISKLYCHQAEAVVASLCGKNVVVATSTSSGKSLCYNIPVIEALSQNFSSCALYIFPTKALAQDQLGALLAMVKSLELNLHVGIYDGDTSQEQRKWIRDNARLLITNPDMLHMSILPCHGQFERILSNIRYVVIDESHTYRGAFGCHTALILRRLQRICSHAYGNEPSFIFCTATSANPREHSMELANLQTCELIQNDGSPCGPKYFLLWNPPLRFGSKLFGEKTENGSVTRRSSSIVEVSRLFAEMVQHGLRCITFCKTRKLSELVLCYTRDILQKTAPDLVDSICVYRAGYIPEDRRTIEAHLFEGKLRGVAATNALELGIDIGHIDATLHLGFPGSIASLWQQAGRSGRRMRPSLAVYVAFESSLDQYFMKFPHMLLQGPIEHCQVDSQNQKVLEQHVSCAAFELPLCKQYDDKHFGSGLDGAIIALRSKGLLGSDQVDACLDRWTFIGPKINPSRSISIRAINTIKYQVVSKSNNEVLEEIEENRAFFQVYEGAVYMHQGNTYLVKDLNLSEKVAFCEKAVVKYYTKTRDYTDIHVIGGDIAYPPVNASEVKQVNTTAQTNACHVTTKWFGFYRISKADNRILDTVMLHLPPYSYESQACWIRVPQEIKSAVASQGLSFRAGQHAAVHALLNVVPLYVMCNVSDLRTECANPHESRNIPERLLLYEQHPGGIGISAQVQLLFRELLTAALELVTSCGCLTDAGCPSCIQTLSCSEYNEVINKKAAIIILRGVIEAENSHFKS